MSGESFATYSRDWHGLDYADQRWYAPGAGRFTSSDPFMKSAKVNDSGSWNRFSYVRGNPTNRWDPAGLADCSPGVFCVTVREKLNDDDPSDGGGRLAGPAKEDGMPLPEEDDGEGQGTPPPIHGVSPVEAALIEMSRVASQIEAGVTPDSVFMANHMKCIAGIETGRRFDPKVVASNGRVGRYQFNAASWANTGTSTPWNNGESAKDVKFATSVAASYLYRKLGYDGLEDVRSNDPARKEEAMQEAIDRFGEHDGRYGLAVMQCARNLSSNKFADAIAELVNYANWVAGGRK